MGRKLFLLGILALMIFFLVSCKKETGVVTATVETYQNTAGNISFKVWFSQPVLSPVELGLSIKVKGENAWYNWDEIVYPSVPDKCALFHTSLPFSKLEKGYIEYIVSNVHIKNRSSR